MPSWDKKIIIFKNYFAASEQMLAQRRKWSLLFVLLGLFLLSSQFLSACGLMFGPWRAVLFTSQHTLQVAVDFANEFFLSWIQRLRESVQAKRQWRTTDTPTELNPLQHSIHHCLSSNICKEESMETGCVHIGFRQMLDFRLLIIIHWW